MKKLIELSSKHWYSCHDNNYYVSSVDHSSWGSRLEFESWEDFMNGFCDTDNLDEFDWGYNLVFRWDCEARTVSNLKEDYWNIDTQSYYEKDLLEYFQYRHCSLSIDELLKMNDEDYLPNISLKLYFMHQRKGAFRPVEIFNLTEEDEPKIIDFLKRAKKELTDLWDLGE